LFQDSPKLSHASSQELSFSAQFFGEFHKLDDGILHKGLSFLSLGTRTAAT